MNWKIIVLLFALFGIIEFFILSACYAIYQTDKRFKRLEKVDEEVELIIETANRNAKVTSCRSEGDYDVDVNKKGTAEIRKILNRIVGW